MRIIVPMAGRGSRLRPHTLTVPKPLIPVAGKPIVERLVRDIAQIVDKKIEEVAFIIGDFGEETEKSLIAVAESLGAKGSIYYQDKPLGTAHAIYCAEPSLHGEVIVAFADTLFSADFKLDESADATIWVNKIDDPSAFGVVKLDENNNITEFVEKPSTFISDLAIIGIYHFKNGDALKHEIKYLLDNDIKDRGEYQITDALRAMAGKGLTFKPGKVDEWLDCGNKDVTVYTNKRVLEIKKNKETLVSNTVKQVNSVIVEPCYIGENVVLENTIVGPHVSVGANSKLTNCIISNAIIQHNTALNNVNCTNSMVGSNVIVNNKPQDLSIGDYTKME
ncbi:MAG: sugar phosphate nucleotidyltransferase [Luteibaculaceae bacterium]